jgi:hypothetical protein
MEEAQMLEDQQRKETEQREIENKRIYKNRKLRTRNERKTRNGCGPSSKRLAGVGQNMRNSQELAGNSSKLWTKLLTPRFIPSPRVKESAVPIDVEGKCVDKSVQVTATFVDINKRYPTISPIVKWRVNNNSFEVKTLETPHFSNQYELLRSSLHGPLSGVVDSMILTTWALRVEFETNGGALVVKVPFYDANVEKFISSCKGA